MAGILYPERDYLSDAAMGAARQLYRRFATTGGTGRGVRRASAIRYKRIGKKRRLIPVPEIKYVDNNLATTVVATGGNSTCVTEVAEGTEYNTRVGRTIFIKYITFDWVASPPTGGSASDYGMLAVVLDRQPNGSLAAQSDVFSTPGPLADKNVGVNASRFKILRRWSLPVLSNTAGTGGVHERVYIPLKNLKVQFKDATAAIPTINSINVYWFSAANTGVAATSFSLAYTIRFAFFDV